MVENGNMVGRGRGAIAMMMLGCNKLMLCSSLEGRGLSGEDLTVEKERQGRGMICGEHLSC